MIDLKAGLTQAQVEESLDELNDLSAAEVNAECDTANTGYDASTGTEIVAVSAQVAAIGVVVDEVHEKVVELATHHHSPGRWFGISGDQTGNNWGTTTLSPFQAISGDNTYGADTNDEAKVIGSDDTPIIAGKSYFDPHFLFVEDVSHASMYMLRIIWGTGTMANAILAGQYSEEPVQSDPTNPQQANGAAIKLHMPRLTAGTKVWVQAWHATDNATIDFLIGIHEYD